MYACKICQSTLKLHILLWIFVDWLLIDKNRYLIFENQFAMFLLLKWISKPHPFRSYETKKLQFLWPSNCNYNIFYICSTIIDVTIYKPHNMNKNHIYFFFFIRYKSNKRLFDMKYNGQKVFIFWKMLYSR